MGFSGKSSNIVTSPRTPFYMRVLTLTAILMALTVTSYTQHRDKCGDYRYVINGKKISSIHPNPSINITVTTYYSIDPKKGYFWLWTEETELNSNQVGRFTSMWSRLTDLDSSCCSILDTDPTFVNLKLSQPQIFFFTTSYASNKNGPQYGVRNHLKIGFKNNTDASGFLQEIKSLLPVYKY